MDPVSALVAFGTIAVVELPDKTFIAALVLSTRFRPLAVWLGVGAAFAVQTGLAVTVGALTTLLPREAVQAVAAGIFLVGAVVLLKSAPGADDEEAEDEAALERKAAGRGGRGFLGAAATSFVVLFTAEWGDLSQLLTISLVGRFDDPLGVFVGAWAALLTVSGIAVLSGRWLLRRLRLSLLHYLGAGVCALLAAVTVGSLLAA